MLKPEQQKIEHENRNEELANCYKRFSNTEDGKKILADLASVCCYDRPIPTGENKWDLNRIFYHEGKRNVYLYIQQKINREKINRNL